MSTPTESRNLALTDLWIELYNTDVHRLINELYEDGATLLLPGFLETTDKAELHRAESYILTKAPDRRARILRSIAKDDTVTVECVLSGSDPEDGRPWETYWCAVLRFRDGRVISDHSYVDTVKWPGLSEILRQREAESPRPVTP
ncbi:nuclear transport factor 2 family protein [Kitasatospora sp. NPDC008115]|uniref:nuclear transport factor 2 family protein n=1 Tax=Kitasatospora sp. NPDC008115 TaxID=3364022 RepID=UPI0036E4E734